MASDQDFLKIKRFALDAEEKINFSRILQIRMLDEIGRRMQGSGGRFVFHGGTNVCATYGSERWSEDLDFMATTDAIGRIFEARVAMERNIRLWGSMARPGSTIDLQAKTDGLAAEIGSVDRLLLRWENPDRIGAIKIKVEFYATRPEVLARYRTFPAVPRILDCETSGPMPCAASVSVWADKIVAMALRPALKHRDIHDLGFMRRQMRYDSVTDADRLRALGVSMSIYDKHASQIVEGLARPEIVQGRHDFEAFITDMRRWFPAQVFGGMRDTGILDRIFTDFQQEFDHGLQAADLLMKRPDQERGSCPGW